MSLSAEELAAALTGDDDPPKDQTKTADKPSDKTDDKSKDANKPDLSKYVTKEEADALRAELAESKKKQSEIDDYFRQQRALAQARAELEASGDGGYSPPDPDAVAKFKEKYNTEFFADPSEHSAQISRGITRQELKPIQAFQGKLAEQVLDLKVQNFLHEHADDPFFKAAAPHFKSALSDPTGRRGLRDQDASAQEQAMQLLWLAAKGKAADDSLTKYKSSGKRVSGDAPNLGANAGGGGGRSGVGSKLDPVVLEFARENNLTDEEIAEIEAGM